MGAVKVYGGRTTPMQPANSARRRGHGMLFAIVIAFQAGVAAQAQSTSSAVATLVARARGARTQQDSMLASYETTVRQRFSAGLGISRGLAVAHGLPLAAVGAPRLA